ncbi:DUF1850 domain-containing protein [Calditerricola satsumensis]|uniref:DUF1850 domain-containing protein n=1 Tax=Calditerricola satsumensis TaxID=373054 RepID=A0A8J3BEK0_9BACI|nr:DUF1850 domain-containing protein [Calditerricola satsumensis]GGK02959.1 hypothetical protein GCM10007043_16250 [Calditerricola satsumensis]
MAAMGPFRRHRRAVTAAILFVTAAALTVMPLFPALIIADGKTGTALLAIPVSRGEHIALHYTHSIHRTPVIETYSIGDDVLVLEAVRFQSYGIGMPSDVEPGQTFTVKNGWFHLDHLNRPLPHLDLRIGYVANHTLHIGPHRISLAHVATPGSWVRLNVKRETLWQRMGRVIQSDDRSQSFAVR